MNTLDLYREVGSPYLGVFIAIIVILPIILIATIFRPKDKDKKSKVKLTKLEKIFKPVEIISFIALILTLCLSKDSFNIYNTNIWFGIMIFFYILYYELIIRYIMGAKEEKRLYQPFVYIKVPISLCLSLGLICTGIWGKNILAIIFSIVFAITHVYCAYKYYMEKFANLEAKKASKDKKKYC